MYQQRTLTLRNEEPEVTEAVWPGMSEELIQHMRERVAKCRWLATMINHPEGKRTLLEMADEGEADIKKLEAEMAANPVTITVGLPPEE